MSLISVPLSIPFASCKRMLQGRISRTRLLALTLHVSSVLVDIAKLYFKVAFPIYILTSKV